MRAGRTADLKKKLQQWRLQVTARMPYANPHYVEKRVGEWWRKRTGQPIDSGARKQKKGCSKACYKGRAFVA